MSFSSYVKDYIAELLDTHCVLTVHDPDMRYREICRALSGDRVTVIDETELTTLEARQETVHVWQRLTAYPDTAPSLLIYRPGRPPTLHEERLVEPLAAFEEMGVVFPRSGVASDTYRDLALQAYPDRRDDVEALFESGEPNVAALDTLESGDTWPSLTAATGQTSATEIILSLLDEDEPAASKVLEDPNARAELLALLDTTLEISKDKVDTNVKSLRDKLWQWLLLSEFILDLPVAPPESLESVPHASERSKRAVFRICKRIRESLSPLYIEKASELVSRFELEDAARSMSRFGQIDTFAFENAALLRGAVEALMEGNSGEAQRLVTRGRESIWYRQDGGLQTPWQLISAAIETLDAIEKCGPARSEADIVGWYRKAGSAVDRAYRFFTFVSGRLEEDEPWGVPFDELSRRVSQQYREWLEGAERALLSRVESEGWPLPGLLRQDRVFSRLIEPELGAGRRVAYFLVDALRFELGEALAEKLSPHFKTAVEPAAALLPTKTPLGMAALGPENGARLSVAVDESGWFVKRGETPLKSAADRDKWIRDYKGDQALVETLGTWMNRSKSKGRPEDKIRLAVVRDTSIDQVGEATEAVFRAGLEHLMGDVARGVRRAFDFGFDVVVIAADHGFLYIPERALGDEVAPPEGTIYEKSSRYAFGAVDRADHLLTFEETDLGYGLSSGRLSLPASIGTFGKPGAYVHGGLSLQEALIPTITVEPAMRREKAAKIPVKLTYRKQTTAKVRSLRPAITVEVGAGAAELEFEEEWATRTATVVIEAKTEQGGEQVGHVDPNEYLDPDTGALVIPVGTTTQIPLRLIEGVEEPFVVRALDFETRKTLSSIHLEFDMLV